MKKTVFFLAMLLFSVNAFAFAASSINGPEFNNTYPSYVNAVHIFHLNSNLNDAFGVNNLDSNGTVEYTTGLFSTNDYNSKETTGLSSDSNVVLQGDASFSISMWVNQYTIQGGDYRLLSVPTGAANEIRFFLLGNTTDLSLGWGKSGSSLEETSTTPLVVNDNHHIVVVRNIVDNSFKLYIDGDLNLTINETTTGETDSHMIVNIGHISDGTNTFKGQIEDVVFFNVALSAADVNSITTKGITGIGTTDFNLSFISPTTSSNWLSGETHDINFYYDSNHIGNIDLNLYFSNTNGGKTYPIVLDFNLFDANAITCNDYNFIDSTFCKYTWIIPGAVDENKYYLSAYSLGAGSYISTSFFINGIPPDVNFSYTAHDAQSKADLNFITSDNGVSPKYVYFKVDGGTLHQLNVAADTNKASYIYLGVGTHSISFWAQDAIDLNSSPKNSVFTIAEDTGFPTMDYNVIIPNPGFVTDFNAIANLRCFDDRDANLTFVIKLNDVNLVNASDVNGGFRTVSTDLNIGANVFIFYCTDLNGNTTIATYPTVYATLFHLVNEQTGAVPVDLNKAGVLGAFVFTYDKNYSYDFNATGTTSKKFIDFNSILRFEFTYNDASSTKVSREVDVSLITDQNIGVCVAPFQQFYEQIITSRQEKEFYLYNEFAKCYNMATSTKFGYKTGKMARGITINKPYYLYIFSNGVKSLLTLIEGSVAVETDLDTLEFNKEDFNISLYADSLSFEPLLNTITGKYDTNTIQIYYFNPKGDSIQTQINIYQDSNLLLSYTETSVPNEFLMNFYYFPYDIDSNKVLKAQVVKTTDAETTTANYYFTIYGAAIKEVFNPLMVIIIVFMLFFFALTFVAYRYAFGWFGLLIAIIGVILLSFVPGYWYVRVAQAVMIIAAIFIGIIFKYETGGIN